MADGCEGALDRVGRPQMLPVLGGEVVEGDVVTSLPCRFGGSCGNPHPAARIHIHAARRCGSGVADRCVRRQWQDRSDRVSQALV
jgi:hypothetical protein